MQSNFHSATSFTQRFLPFIDESLQGLTLVFIELNRKVCISFVKQNPKVKFAPFHIIKSLVNVNLDFIAWLRTDDSFCQEICGEFVSGVFVQDQFSHVVVSFIVWLFVYHLPSVLIFLHVLNESIKNVFDVLLLLSKLSSISLVFELSGFLANVIELTMPALIYLL